MRVLFCSYFALFLLLFVKNEEERFFLPKRNEAKGKLRKEMNEANSANGFHSRAYHRKTLEYSDCPPSNDFIRGAYHCRNDICINDNKGYPDIKTAWEACRENTKCKYIMQWTNGKYYLRASSDEYDSNPDLRYVVFQCPEWLAFKHEGRQESVADPVDIKIWYGIPEIFSYYEYWDSGNIYCETGCHDYQINIRRPGPHMITDVKGNDLKWDDIKNGTTVKIRAIYTSWEGYNYLYSAASGWIYYDQIDYYENKQRWMVKRVGSKVCFESVMYPGYFLDVDVSSSVPYKGVWLSIRHDDNGCMYWLNKGHYWWIIA